MAKKLKIAANYVVFYGEEFIEYSVKSIYEYVERINIAVGKKSWKNHKAERFAPIDNLLEKVYSIPDPDKKIRIYKGIWDSDTEHRNFLLDKCIGKYDYAMLIDADEVWEKEQIQGLRDTAEKCRDIPEIKAVSVGSINYYKSLHWGHKGLRYNINYLFRADGSVHHEWIRHPGTVKTEETSAYYHHYGYAYPPDIIKNKVQMWGHSGEVMEDWFNKAYLPWKPNSNAQAWSPTSDLWEPMKRYGLIPEMEGHRLSKFEYYKEEDDFSNNTNN